MASQGFDGYPKEAIGFLRDLPTRSPDWFKAHKSEYQELVVAPTKALVIALGDALGDELPDLVAQPKTNGSIAPINNDLRFAPDKPPYKDHVMLRFWEGAPKKTAPTLFVRLAPDGVGFASGVMPADVKAWRSMIDSPGGAAVAREVDALAEARDADVVGGELKRVPKPYADDHPRAELLRHRMLQVRWIEPLPASVNSGEFADWCLQQLEPAIPLHRALVEAGS